MNLAQLMKNLICLTFIVFSNVALAGWSDVSDAVAQASIKTGVSVRVLASVGYVESSFRPEVMNQRSSATGMFQITDRTWNYLIEKYADEYGLSTSTRKTNAYDNALVGALYIKDVQSVMTKRLHRKPNLLETYFGHKFGPYRATDLIKERRTKTLLEFYPEAASRNPAVYYKDGAPRTIAGVFKMFHNRIYKAYRIYAPKANKALVIANMERFKKHVQGTCDKPNEPACMFAYRGTAGPEIRQAQFQRAGFVIGFTRTYKGFFV